MPHRQMFIRLLRVVLGDSADVPKIFRSPPLDALKLIQFRREAVTELRCGIKLRAFATGSRQARLR
jgi:hypothetical protein